MAWTSSARAIRPRRNMLSVRFDRIEGRSSAGNLFHPGKT
jgi:hypothetical protein